MEKDIVVNIKRPELYFLLIFLAIVFILEFQVTSVSSIAFGDEGFHVRMAQYMAQNNDYPTDIPFEKTKIFSYTFSRPPLWNLSQAGFYLIFGMNDIIVKFLTPFIAVLTGIVVFILGNRIWNRELSLIASLILVTIPSFVTYSVLFYTDALLVFYLSIFILTYILAIERGGKKYWILAGIFGALSILTKTPGVVVFPVIILGFLYIIYRDRSVLKNLKSHAILIGIVILIIGGYLVRNLAYYQTPTCELPIFDKKGCSKTLEYNSTFKYEPTGASGSEESVLRIGLTNYIKFAYGNIWFVFLGFLFGSILMFLKRNTVSILILLTILSFLPIFYLGTSGRAEDTARYTLGFVPVVALVAANYFEAVYSFIKNYYKFLAIVIFIFVIVFSSFNLNDKLSTMKQVKQFSPLFFEACQFVKENTNKDILIFTVWDSQTAYNCQRNVIWGVPDIGDIVNSNDLELALSRMKAHGITHVFIQKFSINPRYYPVSFVQFLENNPKSFEKIYENGPDLQTCLNQGCDGSLIYRVL